MPFTDVNNGDARSVEVGRFERLILLAALDNYDDTLKKIAKKESDLGVVNLEVFRRRAAIRGEDGWGKSLRGKFAEFASVDDDATLGPQIDLEEAIAEQAKSLVTITGALLLIGVELPEGRLELLTEEERVDVLTWAKATHTAADRPLGEVEVPAKPRVLDELALTDDEISALLAAGPWRVIWDEPEQEGGPTLYLGEKYVLDEGEDEPQETPTLWPSEARARAACALLNREAATPQAEPSEPTLFTDDAPVVPEGVPDVLARECGHCHAKPGEPCRTVNEHPSARPHMQRVKAAGAAPANSDQFTAAIDVYRERVLFGIFGYVTPTIRERARKEGSIDVTAKWAADALRARPVEETAGA